MYPSKKSANSTTFFVGFSVCSINSFMKHTYTHNKTQQAVIDWLDDYDWDIAATFTFRVDVNEAQARKTIKHFWNKVDKAVFGKAAQRHNKRVNRACFIEGLDTGNIHLHAIVKTTERRNYAMLRQIMLMAWESLDGTGTHNRVERTYDSNGWASYISKRIKAFDADALDAETTHITG